MTTINGWLIYRKKDILRNRAFITMLKDATKSRGILLEVIPYEQLSLSVSQHDLILPLTDQNMLNKPDFIINRSVSPWLNEVVELQGIRCFNQAYVARIANDKRLAHAVLANIDIPMLHTTAVHRDFFTATESHFPSSYILKDPLGRGGTGVELIDPSRGISNLSTTLPEDLLHQPVGGKKGKDLRIYIVGNKIVGAVLRESATDFRANISIGGNSSFYQLREHEISTVEKITDAMQMDFVGLDFLIAEDGSLLFNEMEDAVGCRSLYMTSSINIAEIFIEYIYQEISQ
ncbi:ATP-grasp domain-containing protein [Salipaludibacillus sp. HK11]|uniref:ATP-grasp domain-containing protein n=1 Tax=Salipaludibacillus sp. HK11 TaxID=3394320 RepID=UPI0039FC1068